MLIKNIFIGAAIALLAAIGWQYRNAEFLREWLRPQAPPVTVKFDNGSVRDDAVILPAVPTSGLRPAALGTPRKCQGAQSTVYTDGVCPPGTREKAIASGTVTVVESRGGDKARPGLAAPVAGSALRNVIDRPAEHDLAEKWMQRVIGQ